ncbi:MAG: DUF4281 domain-containing protein [Rhodocyclaceae bacterium]|nr:DUF4281 domain-containing protein [Rhodocyclaceae bacterium]
MSSAFTLCNRLALLGWLVLFSYPLWPAPARGLVLMVVITLLCLAYVYFLFLGTRHDAEGEAPRGSFWSLRGVIQLFKSPRAVLAGWIHFLAFDMMVGLYILNDAATRGIGHLWLLPVLVLTLMFGPAGLLAYFVLRFFWDGAATLTL